MSYSKPSAKIILDSISPAGARITTVEVRMHRFVLAEFNTHRAFSRNAASSRAIPISKRIEMVTRDPAMPVEWGRNQAGMQAETLLNDEEAAEAVAIWLDARDAMVGYVKCLEALGVHKQIANRLLEPWSWVTDVVTATDWDNFFWQRCSEFSPLAQPEMRAAADAILAAIKGSTPQPPPPGACGWHTPYIQPEEEPGGTRELSIGDRIRVSVARCARVSYKTQDGIVDVRKDLELFDRLRKADPPHYSPFEHVAGAPGPSATWPSASSGPTKRPMIRSGNFHGWYQLRESKEDDYKEMTTKPRVYGR